MNRHTVRLLVVWCAALMSGINVMQNTHADFVVQAARSAPSNKSTSTSCAAGITEAGVRPALRPFLAQAHDENALASLRRLLPAHWSLQGNLPRSNSTVSWQGGRPWPDIAMDVAKSANLCVAIDWSAHALTIQESNIKSAVSATSTAKSSATEFTASPVVVARSAPPQHDTSEVQQHAPEVHAPVSATPHPITATEPPVGRGEGAASPLFPPARSSPAPMTYALKAGDTVRATFTRWCRAEGWTLVWNADMDYPVEVSMTFPTDTDLRGAVKEVLKAYWRQSFALEGHIYSNQVLEIVGRAR